MLKLFAIVVAVTMPSQCSAQLLTMPGARPSSGEVDHWRDVPDYLAGDIELKFKRLSAVFDGGTEVGIFTLQNGDEFILFFANPLYWTPPAKKESRQPVAILQTIGNGQKLSEIEPGSPLEARVYRLLSESIASNNYSGDELHILNAMRHCIVTRKPLAVWDFNFDTRTWERRPKHAEPIPDRAIE